MEIIRIIIARKSNLTLLLILAFISLFSAIILISYQLSHSFMASYSRMMSADRTKYDFHNEEFDEGPLGKEVHDSVVALPPISSDSNSSSVKRKSIAIGCGITSHNEENLSLENVAYKLPFLRTLVPSFCKTASAGYDYHFYAAFDMRDPHLVKEQFMQAIYERFNEITSLICKNKIHVFLHFVQCSHNHNPTWAQNDAMIEAYLDHIEYYYRVNDDTLMLTPGWTEAYIDGLQGFTPPNVGVVGPLHKGGNEAILTYDFVHRSHIDIFGYYYPRVFTDWWADNWMTKVYGETRTLKLPSVRLIHTGEAGTRYEVKQGKQRFLEEQVRDDQQTLERYLQALEDSSSRKPSKIKKVVSMSLWGSQTRYTFGALRNAQLMPVHFPGWTLRIYVEKPREDDTTIFSPVPGRIVNKLVKLGAEIMRVDAERSHIPPMMWRFLVADDMSVDLFIVRDSDCRLQERDAVVVKEWIASQTAFHCIRDHPSHAAYPLLGGLWGGMPRKLHEILPIPWQELMMGMRSDYSQDMAFLASAIWPKVQSNAFCHDSVSCRKWTNSHPFPVDRIGTEHLGQVFDAFGNARDEDIQILLENRPPAECTSQQRHGDLMEMMTAKSVPATEFSKSPVPWKHPLTATFPARQSSAKSGALNVPGGTVTPSNNISVYLRTNSLSTDQMKFSDGGRQLHGNVNRSRISRESQGHKRKSTTRKSVSALKAAAVPGIAFHAESDQTGIGTVDNQIEDVHQEVGLNVSTQNNRGSYGVSLNQMRNNVGDQMKWRPRTSARVVAAPAAVIWSMDYSLFPLHSIKHLTSSHGVQFIDKSLASGCRETQTCARNLRVITRKNGLNVTEDLIRAFHEEYESDPEMNLVSHFLCTYPVSLCELYTGFVRPLVMYIASRYEHGKYTATRWKQWNSLLRNLVNKTPNRILASTVYDARYLKYFTGIEAIVIPLHCGYVSATYSPVGNAVLLVATQFPSFDEFFQRRFENAARNSSLSVRIVSSSDGLSRSRDASAASHLAAIHIPSDAVTRHFCEHYSMHIPIFVPTVDLAIAWHFQYDILARLTWNSIRKILGESADGSPLPPADGMTDVPDPNLNHKKDSLAYWLKLSGFYRSSNIIYFSSFSDLVIQLQSTDFKKMSTRMMREDARTQATAAEEWLKVFQTS